MLMHMQSRARVAQCYRCTVACQNGSLCYIVHICMPKWLAIYAQWHARIGSAQRARMANSVRVPELMVYIYIGMQVLWEGIGIIRRCCKIYQNKTCAPLGVVQGRIHWRNSFKKLYLKMNMQL